jgi:hypothetical protein
MFANLKYHASSAVAAGLIASGILSGTAGQTAQTTSSGSLWRHDNLIAWTVVPFDAKMRSPEERARMLQRLGFKYFAYDWRDKDIPTFDKEIDEIQRHGIELLAWWYPFNAQDPQAKATLEVFKRHHVHPQLWTSQTFDEFPKTPSDWTKLGVAVPKTPEESAKLSGPEKAKLQEQMRKATWKLMQDSLNNTPQQQQERVRKQADRIQALVKLAAPYGSKVEMYNHNGWFGMLDNQLAVIQRLKELGVTDVGIVYNFSHARDQFHDDTVGFPTLWTKIKPYVVAVNITGMRMDGDIIYPSQGDSELKMMHTIEQSGWRGPLGLIAEKGGDAEVTLRNYLTGLDWLASELKQPGSAGPGPFPPVE